MKTPRHIAVEGPIGVGKTSLTRRLATTLNAETLFEAAAENPFLPQYYANPERHALATQLYFLCQRTPPSRPKAPTDASTRRLVTDFIFEKDRLFAKITLEQAEYALYEEIFRRFAPEAPAPDLVIYLAAPMPILRARIRQRGIDYEQSVDDRYLQRVCEEYDAFFFAYKAAPVLRVDTTEINLRDNDVHYASLVAQLARGMDVNRAFCIDTSPDQTLGNDSPRVTI